MHNLDIELEVIFGIYSGLRLSFRVRKHFKIYCPKASKSSSSVGVMIIANCSFSDPVKCVKFIPAMLDVHHMGLCLHNEMQNVANFLVF